MFQLTIKGKVVIQEDFLNNRSDEIPLENYRWVELFGRAYPFRFFLPLLLGYPPEQVYDKEAKYDAEKQRFSYRAPEYDLIVNVIAGKIVSLYFRNKLGGDIVTFTFVGSVKNKKKRHFPKTIILKQDKSDDYLKIKFKKVRFS